MRERGGKGASARKLPVVVDDERLQAIYAALPTGPCDGCHECGSKCAGEVQMTRAEYLRIRAALGGQPPPPQRERADGEMYAPCRFYEARLPGCLVYHARPLICRLFGLVEWLPCPIGRTAAEVEDARGIISWYSTQDVMHFDRWAERDER
jgi:hypothetical protein